MSVIASVRPNRPTAPRNLPMRIWKAGIADVRSISMGTERFPSPYVGIAISGRLNNLTPSPFALSARLAVVGIAIWRCGVVFHGVNMQDTRLRSAELGGEIARGVHRDHSAFVDDDHPFAGLRHFRQNVGAENDRVRPREILDELACFDDLFRIQPGG